jgi:5-methylcytosine-specific restriction endonuclease McrA
MPGSFCTICRARIPKGSRCKRHTIRSPSNKAWHQPGAAKVRQKVIDRDRVCAVCGAATNLEVHHIVGAAEGGRTETSNLVVLCDRCHDEVEAGRSERW